jgi:hypothetical protein
MNPWWKPTPPNLINFDIMQTILRKSSEYLILNVLPMDDQDCLIRGTINANNEEQILNQMIESIATPNKKIVIYGKNCNDEKVSTKLNQLQKLGLTDVFVYRGGLFEWMLLQDIYGEKEFPTTKREIDLLRFNKPNS